MSAPPPCIWDSAIAFAKSLQKTCLTPKEQDQAAQLMGYINTEEAKKDNSDDDLLLWTWNGYFPFV